MIEEATVTGVSRIENIILCLRGQKVILSLHLAELYAVETKELMQAVRRNLDRFPADFMFPLTADEWKNLRSQFVTSSWGGIRYLPYAFTQEGVAMLSTVLHSGRAVRVSIEIMRAFVRMRGLMIANADLSRRIDDLEKKYDSQFKIVFDAIRALMTPLDASRRRLGFSAPGKPEERKAG
jgi:hypothetical protein